MTTEILGSNGRFTKVENLYPDPVLDHFPLSKIQPREMQWLWKGIIPIGIYTLFAGVGGIGKSQLLIYLAAMVSTGQEFAAGGEKHKLPQGNVLIMQAEDGDDTEVLPRVLALGGNPDNIHCIKSVYAQGKKRLLALDQDIQLLREAIKAIGNVRLIIIDPVQYYTGRVDDRKSTDVVNLLNGLNDLADEFDCAVILNKHLRKKASGSNVESAVDEVSGSGSWVNSARMAHLITRDHNDESKILFMQLKVNIVSKNSKAFSYRIKPKVIYTPENHPVNTTYIEFDTSMTEITADEAISKDGFSQGKEEKIRIMIIQELENSKNGELLKSQLWKDAEALGVIKPTFYKVLGKMLDDGTLGCKGNGHNKFVFLGK